MTFDVAIDVESHERPVPDELLRFRGAAHAPR